MTNLLVQQINTTDNTDEDFPHIIACTGHMRSSYRVIQQDSVSEYLKELLVFASSKSADLVKCLKVQSFSNKTLSTLDPRLGWGCCIMQYRDMGGTGGSQH